MEKDVEKEEIAHDCYDRNNTYFDEKGNEVCMFCWRIVGFIIKKT